MAYIGASPTAVPLTGADIEDGTIGVADLSSTLDFSSKTVTLPSGVGGKVLQVVSTTKTDTFTLATGGNVFTDITGLSATITPSSASSKVYIIYTTIVGMSTNSIRKTKLVRGATDICLGDADGSRQRASGGSYPYDNSNATFTSDTVQFLDSPSTTSATTYKVQLATENATAYINRNGRYNNSAQDGTYTSSITLMEIGA